MIRVSASQSELLRHCAYWAREGVEWSGVTNDAMKLGSEFHAAIEHIFRTRGAREVGPLSDEVTPLVAHARAWLQREMLDGGRDHWDVEVAYAWDPATDGARELGSSIDRRYVDHGLKPHEVAGSTDITRVGAGIVTVYDWKTGWESKDARAQGETLCLMAARAHNVPSARFVQLDVDTAGVNPREPLDLDLFDLDEIAARLSANLGFVDGAEPIPGDWCAERWCPARGSCPATREAESGLVPVDSLNPAYRMALTPTSPGHAAWLRHRLAVVKDAAEILEANLKDYAREHGGIPLADGKVWAETTSTRSYPDAKALEALARRRGANDSDVEACKRTAVVKQFRAVRRRTG